jgi:hypothetical protein
MLVYEDGFNKLIKSSMAGRRYRKSPATASKDFMGMLFFMKSVRILN